MHWCNVYQLKDTFSTEHSELDEYTSSVYGNLMPYVIMYNVRVSVANVLFKAVVVLVKF